MYISPTATPKGIIEEVNLLRSNPVKYTEKLKRYMTYFKGLVIQIPDINVQITTQEGDAPYKETIEYLEKQEPVEKMVPSKALCEISQEILDRVMDSEIGDIEESEAEEIIDKHGTFNGKFTRAMDFGGFTSEQVVINFLVCDGDLDRSQRDPLLGKGLTKIGVAYGKHNIYTTSCVLVSCTEFTNTNDDDDTPVYPKVIFSPTNNNNYEDEDNDDEYKQYELEKQKEYERQKEKENRERQKAIEEGKRREEAKRREEQKKREEAKRKEEQRKRQGANTKAGGDPFNFPKTKFFAFTEVDSEELPEGVASMTKKDTIVIEGGKRYKKIIINKVMLDGTNTTEEIKECLD